MGVGKVKPEHRTSQAPLGDLKSAEKPRSKGLGLGPGLEGWDLEPRFGEERDWSGSHNSRGPGLSSRVQAWEEI